MPLGFVPVEPISEHDRRGAARNARRAGRAGAGGMAGRDGGAREARARRGQSCYTVWEQPAAAASSSSRYGSGTSKLLTSTTNERDIVVVVAAFTGERYRASRNGESEEVETRRTEESCSHRAQCESFDYYKYDTHTRIYTRAARAIHTHIYTSLSLTRTHTYITSEVLENVHHIDVTAQSPCEYLNRARCPCRRLLRLVTVSPLSVSSSAVVRVYLYLFLGAVYTVRTRENLIKTKRSHCRLRH